MELAKRTLRLINVWEPHRGYLNRVRTRLGIVPEDGRLWVENFLQSHTGVIHLFPAVPDNFTGEFENFGAQGGFIVAASKTLEGIQSVTVKSLAGNPCTLVNPWPGKGVEIAQPDGPSRNQDDEQGKLIFDTKIGGTYQLREASSHSDPH